MAERLPPELSPTARALLDAFRDDESPAVSVRQRGLATVHDRVEDASSSASNAANGRFYVKVVAVTVMLAAALLLAVKVVGAGVTALADRARTPAMEAPYQGGATAEGGLAVAREPEPAVRPPKVRATTPPAPAPMEAEVVDPPTEPAVAEVEPTVQTPAVGARRPHSSSERTASVHDLQAEVALIKKATAAKNEGRVQAGLAALREHGRRFAQGTLADERQVLLVELLCAAGRPDEARTRALRFLRMHPRSALAGRMRAACPER
ncbi:MAG: hypothetical protein K0V04_32605 [Deltaproteobacteria bacterium]|nr:hypothetical protein [Deltaproteobacteria bacterium]